MINSPDRMYLLNCKRSGFTMGFLWTKFSKGVLWTTSKLINLVCSPYPPSYGGGGSTYPVMDAYGIAFNIKHLTLLTIKHQRLTTYKSVLYQTLPDRLPCDFNIRIQANG